MRKILIASMAAAAFSLTACSEKTQDAAGETADAMAEDVAATGDAMAEGAADAAAAGDKIKEETAKAEANDKK